MPSSVRWTGRERDAGVARVRFVYQFVIGLRGDRFIIAFSIEAIGFLAGL
jgi:hypothetical protein